MKSEFLKNLGITEQSVIDQIMAENGRDVEKVRSDLNAAKQQVTDLQKQISDKDGEIGDLKKNAGDIDKLNQQIAQLTTDKTNLTNELNTKVAQMQKAHETENKVRDRKAKNVKAVMALLDQDKDIDEQLDALTKGEDTAFLFGDAQSTPSGTHRSTPNGNGGTPATSKTFAGAIANALNKN